MAVRRYKCARVRVTPEVELTLALLFLTAQSATDQMSGSGHDGVLLGAVHGLGGRRHRSSARADRVALYQRAHRLRGAL